MEKCTELTIKNKKIDKIKSFFKDLINKKWFWILLFIGFIYVSNDFLNNESYKNIFKPNLTIPERLYNFGYAFYSLIRFPKCIFAPLLYVFAYWLLYGLTKKTRLSCFLIGLISTIYGIINYIIIDVRGIAISIPDIYSIQTAINVASGIKVNFELFFYLAIIIFTIANIILFKHPIFKSETKDKKLKTRFLMVCGSIIGVVSFYFCNPLMNSVPIWNTNFSYRVSGAGLAIMRMIKEESRDLKPLNYDENEVEEILSKYDEEQVSGEKNYPNILIVMNESFADLPEIFNIDELAECTPYFNELLKEENVISGQMHSSSYGGGTGTVEYEFLTQNTTAFLPSGLVPYQHYVKEEVENALPAYLNKLGYNSYGIHPWLESGYNRYNAYRYLQFNNVVFKEDMNDLEYGLNNYPTDSSAYEYYFDIMNNKASGEKNFTFLVTMQNHIPYNDGIDGALTYVEEDKSLNTFMQLMKESDDALKKLIEFIKNYEEDTIILFFGDHQPNVKQKSNYEINEEYSEEEANYIVPFFIWANYDIAEEKDIETSTNYLQSILLEAAGIPTDEYANYIIDLRKKLPVITSHYYIAEDENRYMVDDEKSPYYEIVQEYNNVIYYQMFEE